MTTIHRDAESIRKLMLGAATIFDVSGTSVIDLDCEKLMSDSDALKSDGEAIRRDFVVAWNKELMRLREILNEQKTP